MQFGMKTHVFLNLTKILISDKGVSLCQSCNSKTFENITDNFLISWLKHLFSSSKAIWYLQFNQI